MRRVIHTVFSACVVIILFLSSCIETFTFEISESEELLVIDGVFTAGGEQHVLYISKTVDYGMRLRDPVSGAGVKLSGNNGTEANYVETDPGRYLLDGNRMIGIPGETYQLEIELTDGSKIISNPEIMPYPNTLNAVDYQFEYEYIETPSGNLFYQKVINIYVDASFNEIPEGNSAYMRWATDELYVFPESFCGGLDPSLTCYVPIEGARQQFSLFSSEDISNQNLSHQEVYKKTLFHRREFNGRHYFTVVQYSLTKEAFEYWSRVQDIANQRGSIFDIPPAALGGNLQFAEKDEPVLGYFELASTDTLRTFIYPSEYRQEIDPTPYCSRFNNTFTPECCNCLRIENATLEKPDWIP